MTIASLFNNKARLWVKGRRNWKQELNNWPNNNNHAQTIWMHCASLGEFEQGRPVLESLRLQFPGYRIVLSFFSSSGYEIRKNYAGADLVCYLPTDNKQNAGYFIDKINPSLVIWVKYEYWYHYLTQLKQRNIPVLLISSIFRERQVFFKFYGGLWRKMLNSFQVIFVQDKHSVQLLSQIQIKDNVIVAGDTRFDRVIKIASENKTLACIEKFCDGKPVIVAGSTWPEDEKILLHYANENARVKFIIAPHEIGDTHLAEIKSSFQNSIFYSNLLKAKDPEACHVLIIDNIGLLSALYRYATLTYIGGGFGESGIHNTLEAAVYSKPVIFGPEYEKFAEAVDLIETGAAFSVSNALELEKSMDDLLNNEALLKASGRSAGEYVQGKAGATQKILSYIQENRLLTS